MFLLLYMYVFLLLLFFLNCSPQARNKVTEMINSAIVHYREDLDLQNLIDFGQREASI